MTTPTVRQVLQGTAVGAAVTLTTGVGTLAGDMLVLVHAVDYYQASDMPAPTPGTWTLQASEGDLSSGHPHIKVWTSAAVGGVQSVTAGPALDSGNHAALYVLSLSSVDGVEANFSTTATTSHTANAVSPSGVDDLLIMGAISYGAAGDVTYTAPTGMTQQSKTDRSPYSTLATWDQVLAASGSTGTRTATASSSAEYAAALIAIKGAVAQTVSDPAGLTDGPVVAVTTAPQDLATVTDSISLATPLTDVETLSDAVVFPKFRLLGPYQTVTYPIEAEALQFKLQEGETAIWDGSTITVVWGPDRPTLDGAVAVFNGGRINYTTDQNVVNAWVAAGLSYVVEVPIV